MPDNALESVVQNAVIRYLRTDDRVAPGMVWRTNVGPLKAKGNPNAFAGWSVRNVLGKPFKGFPDVSCVLLGGRAAFFECKRKGETLTKDQEDFEKIAVPSGAIYAMVTCWEDVDLAFRLHDDDWK